MRLFLTTTLLLLSVPLAAYSAGDEPSYERDVVPLLRSSCVGCHNAREAESGFSVETFASLRQGGDERADPVVPGDPAASVLLQRIDSLDDDHMPPLDHPQPSEAEVQGLRDWIAAGAPPPASDHPLSMGLVVPDLAGFAGRQPITALAYAHDRTRLAVARGRLLEIAPVGPDGLPLLTDPTAVLTLHDLPGKVTAVHFSNDDSHVVVAGGVPGLSGQAELHDASSGALLLTCGGHRDLLYDAELSPDGSLLATAGYDRTIRLWDTRDGSMLREIDVHNAAVFDLAWHPAGAVLASASGDETVKLWRVADGQRLDTLSQPQAEVRSVLFTPDGEQVIAAGRDKRIHVWQFLSQQEPQINPQLHARFAHESPISALAISRDGSRLLSAAEDGSLAQWHLPALLLGLPQSQQPDMISAIAAFSDTRFVVGRMDGSLAMIDASGSEPTTQAASGQAGPPPDADSLAGEAVPHQEAEPNDTPADAEIVRLPARITAALQREKDVDCFAFQATAGQQLLLEVDAARSKSQLDSRLELLDASGEPVPQVRLQAVRDSWFTFRGKDSTQSGDFRLHNWREMELDEYLYAGGEVTRLWLYPRGPDSGFLVYPGFGKRHTFFQTTSVTHALGEPAWIVKALPPHATPSANGLPIFEIPYENDDESSGRLGRDSQLIVNVPADGTYVVRLRDTRGFGSAENPSDFSYTLAIRSPQPSFRVAVGGKDTKVSPGSGRELSFTATRLEGFSGPIEIAIENLPAGFTFHGPIIIEAGQSRGFGVLSAAVDAVDPDDDADKAVEVIAHALDAEGNRITHGPLAAAIQLGSLGNLQLGPAPKVTVAITDNPTAGDEVSDRGAEGSPSPSFVIHPGETITARVVATRHDFTDRISFGNEDSGRNLPYGVFVDNIGLNGLMIVEGQTEREFFITASPVARPGTRLFHLRATGDGGQCAVPVAITVLP